MLNLERLRALHAVAENGSVAAAARTLHVTPSGISQQLNKLEREVGVPLLEPQGPRCATHRSGPNPRAPNRRGSLDARPGRGGNRVAAERGDGPRTYRRPGLPQQDGAAASHREIRHAHPQLEITFNEGESEELLPALIRRDLDVVVVDSWSTLPVELPDGLSFTPVYDDVALLALPASHPLAENKVVALSELSEHAWATWTRGTDFHTFTVRTLRAQGFDPRIEYEVAEFPTQVEFVAQASPSH